MRPASGHRPAPGQFVCSSNPGGTHLRDARAETTVFDDYSGMSQTCIRVMPDGRYRLEKSFWSNSGGGTDATDERVFLDSLPDAGLKQLQSVLDDGKFRQIRTEKPKGGIVQEMDTLVVTIPPKHNLENMAFMNAAGRRRYEKDLRPLENRMKDLEKRKAPRVEGEKGDNCPAPPVMYRTMSADPTPGGPDNQY